MIGWKNKPEHSMYNVLLFEYVHKTILYISNSIYMYTKAKKSTCEDKHRTSNIDYMGRNGRGKWGEEVEEEDVSSAVVFSPLTKENICVPYLCGLKCLHGRGPFTHPGPQPWSTRWPSLEKSWRHPLSRDRSLTPPSVCLSYLID